MENIKSFNFKLEANDGKARAGIIETIHGNIKLLFLCRWALQLY